MTTLDLTATWPVDHVSAAVVADSGVREQVGETTRVYELASVTKLLSAYAVLVAVEEGVVEFDQPAGPRGSTVRHLLAHASGLAFADRTVQAPAGTKRIYSSAGFEVLAELIETESGISFPDYLDEAVCLPLQMTDTSLVGPAGHGARSSLADLIEFAAELLTPTLIAPQTHRSAVAVQFPGLNGIVPGYGSHKPCDWGLGFELRGDKTPHWTGRNNSPSTFGHFGQAGTFLWVDPVAHTSCVVLTDRAFGEWAKPLWPELSDAVLMG